MQFSKRFLWLLNTASLAFPGLLAAQEEQEQDQEQEGTGVHYLEEIHVTGVLRDRSADELAQSISVIREQTLERIARANLGETLSGQLGVSSSYFSSGASRPIIRGLAGARVRTMEDGLDSMDVSTVSVDHAVSIDPLVARQIEIFRGPTTLLYGSGAVGGVINTVTTRIPEDAPANGLEGVVELKGDSAADLRSGLISVDGGNEDFAWHFDFVSREADDYEIPGYAELEVEEDDHDHEDEDHDDEDHEDEDHDDDDHEDEDHEDEDHEDEHEEQILGLVENSSLTGEAFSLGGSWLRENGYFGVSVSGFDTNYGIPGHHHHHEEDEHDHEDDHDEEHGHDDDDDHDDDDHDDEDHDEDEDHDDEEHEDEDHEDEDHEDEHGHEGEEAPVRIDLKQTRVDVKGGWVGLEGPFEAINLRFGVNSYEHVELEGDEIGTLFENDSWEGRLEFMHAPWGEWDGAYGVQVSQRQFSAIGAEAFVPPVDTSTYGAFIVEQRDIDDWHLSLGARLEYQQQDPSGDLPTVNDTATSFSLAAVRDLPDGYSFITNAALAQRLPVAEELYADGPHLATQSIEIGNPDIGVETSRHLDIGLRSSGEGTYWSLTAFLTSYADFIYLENTGEIDDHDELPIYHFEQDDANFSGIEAEFFTPLLVRGGSELDLRVFADYVNGELGNGENVPRMPPLRYGSRIQYHNEQVLFGLEVTQYDDQTDIAHTETPTAGYTMINADVNWTITTPGGTAFEVFVIGTNLADEDARKHTSFVKNSLPLPGRNISAGFRSHF